MSYFRRNNKKIVSKRDFTQTINDIDNDIELEIQQNDVQANEIELQNIRANALETRLDTLEIKETDMINRIVVLENILNNLLKIT